MERKTATRTTDTSLVPVFAKSLASVGKKQEPALVVSMPTTTGKPSASATPLQSTLPLFMEPVFKAREYDPL